MTGETLSGAMDALPAQPCRHCGEPLRLRMLDLGFAPPSNAYRAPADLRRPETTYPLRVFVCGRCRLVQTEDYAAPDSLFDADYAYFSSTSRSWLDHAARYVDAMIARYGLGADSFVVEIASNDGYLLMNVVAAGVPCLGIEPTASTAAAAEAIGVPTLRAFFGEALGKTLAEEGRAADLIHAANVYAHVPDINDFTRGLAAALKPEGVATLEFPHLLRMIEGAQFDTVYHEHYSYLALGPVRRILAAAGLRAFDVEELPTHGGSLRVHACRAGARHVETPSVAAILDAEARAGLMTDAPYRAFQARAEAVKDGLLSYLIAAKREGRRVAGYGAAAKGVTLINFAGVKPDLLPYVCDAAPSKQGRCLPGSHIPILPPAALDADAPDDILILPWNIAGEVRSALAHHAARGARFVIAVPDVRFL